MNEETGFTKEQIEKMISAIGATAEATALCYNVLVSNKIDESTAIPLSVEIVKAILKI